MAGRHGRRREQGRTDGAPERAVAPDRVRAFFAVELDEAARREVERQARRLADAPGGDDVRWVRPEAYHVTLRFLGNVPVEQLGGLAARVREAVRGTAPFELTLGGLHALPSARRPRILAVDLEGAEPLVRLADAVEEAVVAAGLTPEERPFHPHVTLGRVRRGRPPAFAGAEVAPVRFPVREVVLFRSDLASDGARYTPLERIALEAPST